MCLVPLQLATAESARQQAAEQVEELSEALSDARNALAAAQQDAGTRAARLAHLEGEFEALQVRGCWSHFGIVGLLFDSAAAV